MALYRTVNTLSIADAAYIAGLVDGEGTIGLTRKHANENRQLNISIASTEPAILDFVIKTVGAGKITRKRHQALAHHKPGFTYVLWNRQALSLLAQIEPYLRSYKRERCVLVVQNYLSLTPRNGKYTAELSAARLAFEEEFFRLRVRNKPFRPEIPAPIANTGKELAATWIKQGRLTPEEAESFARDIEEARRYFPPLGTPTD